MWSVAGFVPGQIERREEPDLSPHIRGATHWNEVSDDEGYFVFDQLNQVYRAVEYEESTHQWYFIKQETRTGNWIAYQPVPSLFQLGRESIKPSTIQAANVDNSQAGTTQQPQDH